MVTVNTFNFGEHQIRTAGTAEDPLFCIGDVCEAIELKNPSQAAERLEQVDIVQIAAEKGSQRISYSGPNANAYVTESGLYDLILGSAKGREFRRWVTSEVLPSIRKTGSYSTKPLTHIQMLAAQAQAMADLEARQLAHEQRFAITEAGVAALEAAKAQSEAELQELKLLPPASSDAPPETEGELTVAVLKTWGFAHAGAYQAAYRMLYTAVLNRATRIDLRARLKNAKGRRLADVIDATGKAGAIYAIARELFVAETRTEK